MYSHNNFPNKKPDEHVLMFLRRHWVVVVKIIFFAAVLSAVPPIFYVIFLQTDTNIWQNEASFSLLVLVTSAYYLFVVLFTYASFVDYYLDVWMVTNHRIINIEQRGLFSRVISEKDLGRMQDITSDISGFFPTLLNYGDVHIQTAAEKERFVFREVPFADEVARRVSNLVAEYQKLNKDKPI